MGRAGTLTLLFTDIEASTRLLRELGARYPPLLADHQRRLRAAASEHHGFEVNTQGDAFFFVFDDAGDACAAAADFHAALEDGPIRVRIGIHTGEPERVDDDYAGIDVHRAARICAAGHGGQTVISERTRSLLPASGPVQDLGQHRLKDLGGPEKLFQLGDGSFPPLRSLNATNLPSPASPLVGRRDDVRRISELVRTRRVVTLAGPGGAGKTRLSLQVAAELVQEFPDGVYWVSLAAVRDPALVLPSVAEVLGASGPIGEHIDEKRMLLVLDNLEQVIDCAADLAGVLGTCPNVTLLVTSRILLNIAGECVHEVEPMVDSEAVELFAERATVAEPVEAVREICRRLDRLPLAIELAAARTRLLPPAELLARLERVLPVLTGGTREAPARQRTLRAAIEWSHDLLPQAERLAFRRLAVFSGSFDLDAAHAVCGAGMDQLESLLDQSLLRRTHGGRLFMLETIREFAEQMLEESGEAHGMRRAHAGHFLDVAERAASDHHREGAIESMRRLQEDEDNVRAALEFGITTASTDAALRLCCALERYWEFRAGLEEGAWWFERALALPAGHDPRQRVRALRLAGLIEMFTSRIEAALELERESVELGRRAGDPLELAASLREFVRCATLVADDPLAERAALEESLRLSRDSSDRDGEARSLHLLGLLLVEAGDSDAGTEVLERSVAITRERGDHIFTWATVHGLADVALDRRDLELARSLYREVLREAAASGHERVKIYCLAGLAAVAALDGDHRLAGRIWRAVEAAEQTLNYRMVAYERARYEQVLEPVDASDEAPLEYDAAVAVALGEPIRS